MKRQPSRWQDTYPAEKIGEVKGTKSKNVLVYGYLHTMILKGKLVPGSRVTADQIAAQLGVSPIPVREALLRLEAEGFVTLEPYVGAKVTELRESEVQEVFGLLGSLALICGRSACLRLSDADLIRIETLLADMENCAYDPEAWSLRNKELHLFIGEKSEHKLALRMLRLALDHWDRLWRHFLEEVFSQRIPAAHAEHVQMLAAFRARSPKRLEEVVRVHNEKALHAYLTHLATNSAQTLQPTPD